MPQLTMPDAATLALAGEIAASFAPLPEVAAVALAGSQTLGAGDNASDLDIYVYTRADVGLAARTALAEQRGARRVEVGNDEWGPGDEWEDGRTGRSIDLIYFGATWLEDHLDRLLVQHQPSLGYTTAIWSTVQRSIPLFDRDGWFAHVQARANQPYPEPLRRAIIAKNQPILRAKYASYRNQLQRAFTRRDRVSVNHRMAALLASYFDILFALNRAPHPGEKRQIAYARAWCPLRPADFEAQIEALLYAQAAPWDNNSLLHAADTLIAGLERVLQAEGF